MKKIENKTFFIHFKELKKLLFIIQIVEPQTK